MRHIVNVFWKEAGYPGLHQAETWATAEAPTFRAAMAKAREIIRALRQGTAGLHSIRVKHFAL